MTLAGVVVCRRPLALLGLAASSVSLCWGALVKRLVRTGAALVT